MKKLLIIGITACIAIACKSAASVQGPVEVGPYTVEVIMDGVYHIQDYNSSNPAGETVNEQGEANFNNCSDIYLVVGKQKALLIDLSNRIRWAEDADESLRLLVSERAGEKPVIVTFTHNHGDHTGMLPAMKEYPGVSFALPRVDFERMEERFADTDYCFFDEGYEFEIGGRTVNTVLVPGHTDGSVVFDLEGENILFTGDAVGSGHGVWIFNEDGYQKYTAGVPHLIEYIESSGIDKEALKIYGGHYWQKDWLNLPEGIELGMQYLLDMQGLISKIADKSAFHEPSELGRDFLDTYFFNGEACITYNAKAAGFEE